MPAAPSDVLQSAHCPECSYNLAGLSTAICPECGLRLTPPAKCPSRLTRRICALGIAPMALVLLMVCITNWEYFHHRAIIFRCAEPLFTAWPPTTAIYWLLAIAAVIGKWASLIRLARRDYSRQSSRTLLSTIALICAGAAWDVIAACALFVFLGGKF